MAIMKGDRFRHKFTNQMYKVKIIKNGTLILESKDSPYRVWIGDGDVDIFFETVEKKQEMRR
jgi:hypothetical protein